jgi:PPK2 family polyphosphate:nucleotide phosphotransferase
MKSILFDPVASPYLVPYDGSFRAKQASTRPPADAPGKKDNREVLEKQVARLDELQRLLYAHDRYSVLLVFQAMDAAGKDGTIRALLTGVNPAGCQVASFKAPSSDELEHDFLWRIYRELPERGRIGVFNRSHYEEALVVRVHPAFLDAQRLPRKVDLDELWRERYDSMRDFERHLARNGTVILKFWLNVSREEQRDRLVERIDQTASNWKFSATDVAQRANWDEYIAAYQDMLNETSRPWAPWYAIPADSKSWMRRSVAEIVVKTLERLDMHFPTVTDEGKKEMEALRRALLTEPEK